MEIIKFVDSSINNHKVMFSMLCFLWMKSTVWYIWKKWCRKWLINKFKQKVVTKHLAITCEHLVLFILVTIPSSISHKVSSFISMSDNSHLVLTFSHSSIFITGIILWQCLVVILIVTKGYVLPCSSWCNIIYQWKLRLLRYTQ